MQINKVIIPAAGLGTRFFPLTKIIPKEMIPLFNKPAIHYIIDEAINSEINQFLIITSKKKDIIKKYFNQIFKNNTIKKIESPSFVYINQQIPRGLGDAIMHAQKHIKNEYFGVMLPDDLIFGKIPCIRKLIKIAQENKCNVIAVKEVNKANISSYGVISIKNKISENLFEVKDLIEKPSQDKAPSNFAIVGRYVLSVKIFKSLKRISLHSDSEIQLTDGISNMIRNGEKVLAYKTKDERYDIGTPKGWANAIISLSLKKNH